MKNILSVKAQERTTQNRVLYPSAVRPEQTTPPERPKQTTPLERRAPCAERPFFQSKQTFGGFITTRGKRFSCLGMDIYVIGNHTTLVILFCSLTQNEKKLKVRFPLNDIYMKKLKMFSKTFFPKPLSKKNKAQCSKKSKIWTIFYNFFFHNSKYHHFC